MTPKQNKFTEDVFSPPSGFDVLKVGGITQRCLKERGGWTAGEMTGVHSMDRRVFFLKVWRSSEIEIRNIWSVRIFWGRGIFGG